MSQPEWMRKYQQIGQKGPEAVTTIGEAGTIEQTADATQEIDPRSSTGSSEDAGALFHAAAASPPDAEEEDAAALFQAAGNAPAPEESVDPSMDSSAAGVDSSGSADPESSAATEDAPPQPERSDFAASAYASAQQDDVGESWIVDKDQLQQDESTAAAAAAEEQHQHDELEAENSGEEEEYYDDEEYEEHVDGDEEVVEEEYVDEDRGMEDQYYDNEQQAQAMAATQSRSAKVAPAPQDSQLPVFNIEEQRKVILSSAKGKRSHMSPAVPIMTFLIIVAAILLVVFLVVLKEDDATKAGPSMAPSIQFLPLEPTSNGNVPSAATTRFDPYQGSCDFALLNQPNVIDQCECNSRVTIVADDIQARREDLVNDFMQSVFPGWNEAITSCSPENQALLWMSSGVNNGGEVGNLLKLQRFALAVLYIRQGGTEWRRSTNWMTEVNVCEWENISCNGQNFVRTLRLDRNGLTGQISDAPALLNAIEGYSAAQNGMTSNVPLSFLESNSLQSLDLSSNDLSGDFPRLNQESKIRVLNLASNKLSGSIPREIFNATSLESLNIEANTFSSELPSELFELPLQELAIGGNIFDGTIPTQLATVTTLTSLSLGPNMFEDEIPTFLGDLTNLEQLAITGIPGLQGRLPAQYGLSLTKLQDFLLTETSVNGNIPDQFSGLKELKVLRLSGNALGRAIPGSLGQLTNLVTLDLSDNDFTGIVPASISSLYLLEELQLHTNSLVGSIPSSFGNLANLRTLTLDGNFMNGRAPEDVCALRDVQLDEFVVDCPTLTSGDEVVGIICSVPDCCTECL